MINVSNVSKSFGDIQALQQVSFEIKEGEIYGLLGPNGAGKSTTINILNTLLKPDEGEVYINGLNVQTQKEGCKMLIGVVPQEIALYSELSAFENVMFWGGLYNLPKAALKEKALKALELVGLSDRKNDRIKTYSGGMKRRINIASSILHDPKVILMDEPTVGVDPQSRNHVFEVIENLNKEGKTIIYTTHYMEEAERLCDRIAIIDLGQIIAQGDLKELKEISKVKDILTLQLANLDSFNMETVKNKFPDLQQNGNNSLLIECNDLNKEVSGLIKLIQEHKGEIESIETHKANLESVFLKLTGKQLRD